jgi:hypothetical protein
MLWCGLVVMVVIDGHFLPFLFFCCTKEFRWSTRHFFMIQSMVTVWYFYKEHSWYHLCPWWLLMKGRVNCLWVQLTCFPEDSWTAQMTAPGPFLLYWWLFPKVMEVCSEHILYYPPLLTQNKLLVLLFLYLCVEPRNPGRSPLPSLVTAPKFFLRNHLSVLLPMCSS